MPACLWCPRFTHDEVRRLTVSLAKLPDPRSCGGRIEQTHMRSRMLQRPLADLIAALRRHAELLRFYAHRTFQECDELFLGEVASKLRMLVAEHGRSQPLLLDLMDELGADIRFKLD